MLRSIFSGYELIFLNTHLYKEEEGSTHGGCCLIFTLNLSYLQRSTFVFSPHCLYPPFLAPPRATEASLLPLSPPIQSAVPEPAYLWGADPISYHPDRRVQILEILREVSQDGLQRVLMARSTLWNQHFLLNRSRVPEWLMLTWGPLWAVLPSLECNRKVDQRVRNVALCNSFTVHLNFFPKFHLPPPQTKTWWKVEGSLWLLTSTPQLLSALWCQSVFTNPCSVADLITLELGQIQNARGGY